VSREHSKIFPQGADFYIVDLNSRNGTLVNDAPVTRRLLRDGDEILLGATRFRFELDVAEAKPEAEGAPEAVKEVVDLSARSPATPAGAIRADEIVVKEKALQFSKQAGRKRPSLFFDDLGQKNLGYQILMFLVVAGACIAMLLIGLYLGGVIGAD
jgi:pSer/pThr/pTyr-binding forkhead associated (FHA) protein